jgi:hypothetical protein
MKQSETENGGQKDVFFLNLPSILELTAIDIAGESYINIYRLPCLLEAHLCLEKT